LIPNSEIGEVDHPKSKPKKTKKREDKSAAETANVVSCRSVTKVDKSNTQPPHGEGFLKGNPRMGQFIATVTKIKYARAHHIKPATTA